VSKSAKSVTCARDAMAYPPECFSLPTDGRKAKHMREQRRALFIQFALYADGDGTRAWPGEKRICKEMGLKRRTAERLIADLRELECVVEKVGPDGKIKLCGPRGTTERVVNPKALPAPGSTAWTETPQGMLRFVFVGGCRYEKDGTAVPYGDVPVAPNSGVVAGAVAPDTNSVAPNSTPVAPHTIAVAPKLADFGAQPPRITDLTATTTATNSIGSTPGAEAGAVSNSGQAGQHHASGLVGYIARKLDRTSLPSTPRQRRDLEALSETHGKEVVAAATDAWCRERDLTGMKQPLYKFLEEIPPYIKAARARAEKEAGKSVLEAQAKEANAAFWEWHDLLKTFANETVADLRTAADYGWASGVVDAWVAANPPPSESGTWRVNSDFELMGGRDTDTIVENAKMEIVSSTSHFGE
jgi:hypothetical protein